MRPATLLLALSACGWNHLPQQDYTSLDQPLWDARGVVPTIDGLYVPLPASGGLALIAPKDEPVRVDIGEGRLTRVAAAPDGNTVITFVERYTCVPDDAREARRVDSPEECDNRDLEVETELGIVAQGRIRDAQPMSGAYNAISFSDDGRYAVAYLDFSQDIQVDGVLNLTGVVIIDLERAESTPVPVGFAADRVLFVEDDGGAAAQAVVLSRNAVAVVDLLASPPETTVTYPLTLDPDSAVDPVGIDLTPDGRYALISVRYSSDLYAIDLEQQAINIVELTAAPTDMAVSEDADRTVLVYGSRKTVDLIDHTYFDVTPIDLEEGMDRIALAPGFAVLYGTADQHDLYRLDLENDDLVEYRLQNPAVSVHLAPTSEFAIALTRAEGGGGGGVDQLYDENPGMEIVDLRSDETTPFLLEGQGLGVAFAGDELNLSALVLQESVDYLFRLDLYTRQSEEIELSAPPVAIGTMPDGQFYITHDQALGLVSFLDPDSGKIEEVAGFATLGMMDPIELVEEVQP